MAIGKKTGGRQKGSTNKVTSNVKDNMLQVFDALGGVAHMAIWAKDNETEFYRLYSKLIPTDITAKVETEVLVKLPEASAYLEKIRGRLTQTG